MAEDRIVLPGNEKARILKWKIAPNAKIGACAILGLYQPVNSTRTLKLKCSKVGTVKELVAKEGDLVKPGYVSRDMIGGGGVRSISGTCLESGPTLFSSLFRLYVYNNRTHCLSTLLIRTLCTNVHLYCA